MPTTVPNAFTYFRENIVDLDPGETEKALRSRDYLKDQISSIASGDAYFPPLYGGYMPYGSFARKTKVRPLDDIDMLLLLNGKHTVQEYYSGYIYSIRISDSSSPLYRYTNDNDAYLNSTRILNKIKDVLSKVPNYQKADLKRNNVAVVLKLASYPWAFDIVPAFPISDNMGGISHYLIPDGNGRWTRTDPRRDKKAITDANKYHNQNLIPLIRIIKHWNARYYDVPTISSYLLETILINGFKSYNPLQGIRGSIPTAFAVLASSIQFSCADPKQLGANLDEGLSWDVRNKVNTISAKMSGWANNALEKERKDDHKVAFDWWKAIFHDFPSYG